jgi:6-phosphogluconolactonase
MDTYFTFPSKQQLAEAASKLTVDLLQKAIAGQGAAIWVLAGGSTPLLAYEFIAKTYLTDVDWSKVIILIGDERISTYDSVDNNWRQAEQSLLRAIPQATFLRPDSEQSAEAVAEAYARSIAQLPQTVTGQPRFDVVWLGVGDDGQTLSLFPQQSSLDRATQLVVPIHNSPKPPADRISLSLHALKGTVHCLVLAAGADKATAITAAKVHDTNLPIVRATQTIIDSGGEVTWLLDQAVSTQ